VFVVCDRLHTVKNNAFKLKNSIFSERLTAIDADEPQTNRRRTQTNRRRNANAKHTDADETPILAYFVVKNAVYYRVFSFLFPACVQT
jgi:hypothetical protein